jgi:hypothetical protein
MRTSVAATAVLCLTVLAGATPAQAQYGAKRHENRATGETYHVEVGGLFWDPTPEIAITSESLGIIGSKIDFVEDLGIEKSRFKQLKIALRPATKHKFRFEYTPITYTATSTLHRNIVFNGILYPISLPVQSELKWKAYRFGYEWDFVYRDRGFVGLLLDMKYTDVEATLANVLDTEFVHARAPIPAIGGIGRVYPAANVSITGEFTFFKLPDIGEDFEGRYYDFDLYGTVNFTDYVGAQAGYRSFSASYKVDEDQGELLLKGFYFGGVVRF